MVTLIVLACIASYLGSIGYVHPRNQARGIRNCKKCSNNRCEWCSHDHAAAAVISSLFWPLFGPIFVGNALGRRHEQGISRDDRRRTKEIEEAKHQRELAKIAADEAEHLNRQLRAADKHELVR